MNVMTRVVIPALAGLILFNATGVHANSTTQECCDCASEIERVTSTPIILDIHFNHRKLGFVYDNNWPVEKCASGLTGILLNNTTPVDIHGIRAYNLMLASGDLPDIVGGRGLRTQFNTDGPQGYFFPLNDLIKKHAPHIDAFFDENPDILADVSAPDGNLYHIPFMPDGEFARAYFIRTDWLEALNLDVPDTVDDLYNVLKAFKNDDPNCNGVNDETPYFVRDHMEVLRLVTLWGARTSGSLASHDFYVKDGRITHGYIEDSFRVGIENLAKWFSEGLIDQEAYSREGDVRRDMLASNTSGMTHDWFASTASFNEHLDEEIEGFSFKPIAPPENINGVRIEETRRTTLKPDGWAITRDNKFPVETMKYFDFWYSPYGGRLANLGIEGSEYTLVDGKPVFAYEVLNADTPVNEQLWSIGAQIPLGFLQNYEYERQWTNEIALEGMNAYEKAVTWQMSF